MTDWSRHKHDPNKYILLRKEETDSSESSGKQTREFDDLRPLIFLRRDQSVIQCSQSPNHLYTLALPID